MAPQYRLPARPSSEPAPATRPGDGRLTRLALELLILWIMRGKATALGHGVHPMATGLPVALLSFTPVADLVAAITGDPSWARAACWLALVGVVAGAVVALPALVDWLAAPRRTRARVLAGIDLVVTAAALALAGAGVLVRLVDGAAHFAAAPFALALAAAVVVVAGARGASVSRDLCLG